MNSERVFADFPDHGEPSLPVIVGRLLESQRKVWPDLQRGMEALSSVQIRTIVGKHYSTLVQFNPIRITSTGAKVDPQTIARRKCFLCVENLPDPQRGVRYRDEYLILCNPAPIFRGHYTISHIAHRPQAIGDAIATLLALARDLSPSYQVFYNGPRCGASAPDHLHFQASPTGSIPMTDRRFLERHANNSVQINGIPVTLLHNTDRSVLVFRAPTAPEATLVLERILHAAGQVLGISEEPLVNILAWWTDTEWDLVVVLRSKHRPDAYFREDSEKLLISPAAVDMGGLVITPREEDFSRLDARTIKTIYREVSLESSLATTILEALR